MALNDDLTETSSPLNNRSTKSDRYKFHTEEGKSIIDITKVSNLDPLSVSAGTFNNIVIGTAAITGGTINNAVMGTPDITGGSFDSGAIGTPAITGGTFNSGVVGTPAITGGTINTVVMGTPDITGGSVDSATLGTPTIDLGTGGTQGDIYFKSSGGAVTRLAPGTSGHYLQTQGTDADPVWAAAAGGGDVSTDSIWDAKGDIAVGTADDAAVVLSVGTVNGHVLTVDSTQAEGVKWAAQSGGGDMGTATYDPNAIQEQLVGTSATQTLTNKTLNNPTIGTPTITGGTTNNATLGTPAIDVPRCSVYMSTNGTISNNTDTTVNFDSEYYDTDTMHSTASNTSRITFTTGGLYLVVYHAAWNAGGSGIRQVYAKLNGSTILPSNNQNASSSRGMDQQVTLIKEFSASDYIEMIVYQTSGTSRILEAADTYFAAQYLSKTA